MIHSPDRHVVCVGEVLWDLLPGGALPGGAPMNVGYHLNKLGSRASLITRIGLDDRGKELVQLMSANGLTTEYVDVDYNHDTGLVYAFLEPGHEVSYDIIYPSAWDFIEWKEDYRSLVQSADFLVYGSLASRHSVSKETIARLLELPVTRVLDVNLRPPHFQRPHIEFLLQKADIVKMNLSELELMTGWFSRNGSTSDRMKMLRERFSISILIVTMGSGGAMVQDEFAEYSNPGYKVSVADTIGSGDAFLAGYLNRLQCGASTVEALNFASAIGAFIATQSGACPEYDISSISALINNKASEF